MTRRVILSAKHEGSRRELPLRMLRGFFSIFPGMRKNLPGLLCLLAMPCCVLIFVKVQAVLGDLLALLASLLFYIAVIVICVLLFNKPDPRNMKMEHPIIKDGETLSGDAAGSPKAAINDCSPKDSDKR